MPVDLFRYIELGGIAVLAVGLLGIVSNTLSSVLRQGAARDIAERRERTTHNERMAVIFENHMSVISENQAKTANSLTLILDRLKVKKSA